MMKGKDLKQAKLIYVNIGDGVERPLTFDFNALCELQDQFIDPFVAVAGISAGDVTCLRALLHSCLVAGQLAVDESVEMDLTLAQVGRYLGMIMPQQELYEEIYGAILEGVALFFPDKQKETPEKIEEETKN